MRSLSAAEYSLVALVLLSVAGKVATNTADASAETAERSFASAVVSQLSHAGFDTAVEHWPTGVVVHARRGACEMWVRDYGPHGTFRNVYEDMAEPVGSLRYVYNGATFQNPPKLEPLLRYFFRREMLRLGVPARKYPIYAVASSAACAGSPIAFAASIG